MPLVSEHEPFCGPTDCGVAVSEDENKSSLTGSDSHILYMTFTGSASLFIAVPFCICCFILYFFILVVVASGHACLSCVYSLPRKKMRCDLEVMYLFGVHSCLIAIE